MIRFAILWVASDDDDTESVAMETREGFTAGYAQGVLGGDFEVFTLWDGSALYIRSDGKHRRLKPNGVATRLAREMGGLGGRDFIAGSAIVVGRADRAGNDTSLTGPVLEWVLGAG